MIALFSTINLTEHGIESRVLVHCLVFITHGVLSKLENFATLNTIWAVIVLGFKIQKPNLSLYYTKTDSSKETHLTWKNYGVILS